jgi:ACT domain
MPYLMRVELPDVPGSLGRVAATIGEAGGDIEAIEIVEHRPDGTAVDDVLLETVPGVMPDSLVSACNMLDGVQVLWISRYGAGGNLFLDLEAVEALTANPATALDELVDLLPITFRADWGLRVRRTDRGVEFVHGTSAAPDLEDGQVDWFPLARAARLAVPEAWERWTSTLVAGAPLGDDKDEIVVFGRRGGPDVLDSELARLQHLAALAVTIARAG